MDPSGQLVLEASSSSSSVVTLTDRDTGSARQIDASTATGDGFFNTCIDDGGRQLAYWHMIQDTGRNAVVIQELSADKSRETVHVTDRHGGMMVAGFSPGGGDYLSLHENMPTDVAEGCRSAVVLAVTGDDARWNGFLPVVFGGGFTPPGSLHWATGLPLHSAVVVQPSVKSCAKVLHAVVGAEVVLFDVDAFAIAVKHSVFDVPQLLQLGSHTTLAKELPSTLPHGVNVQDEDGNTVLHHYAKQVRCAQLQARDV